jgi:hypothetical protein
MAIRCQNWCVETKEKVFEINIAETIKSSKNLNTISFNIISEDKDILVLGANTNEEMLKWVEAFHDAFKDITEEHRAAVKNMDNQAKMLLRSCSMQDTSYSFGRGTIGKGKNALKSGLSSVAQRKVSRR